MLTATFLNEFSRESWSFRVKEVNFSTYLTKAQSMVQELAALTRGEDELELANSMFQGLTHGKAFVRHWRNLSRVKRLSARKYLVVELALTCFLSFLDMANSEVALSLRIIDLSWWC